MNKFSLLAISLMSLLAGACSHRTDNSSRHNDSSQAHVSEPATAETPAAGDSDLNSNIPPGAQALIKAYPDFVKGYANGHILFTDGSSMIYDDGHDKDFPTMLDNSDIEDMFYTKYIEPVGKPGYLSDAGRSRNEALFKKMYGASAGEVKRKLVDVPWFGQTVEFTSVNGAADSLRAVAADISRELARNPSLKTYLKSSGTFYWRNVRGAKRQSAHSYGIAFDIAVDHADYWLWKNPQASETDRLKYANRIPPEIVRIFHRHGFIWGGAWYHYDTMHFEFRPEILEYANRAD